MSAHQVRDLEVYLADRGFRFGPAASDAAADRADAALDARAAEDSEQPRFIRGFHDILITIGIVVVLIGLWGLTGPLATLPVILVLAEILVRRQRLALPSVVLTLALVHWVAMTSMWLVDDHEDTWHPLTFTLVYVATFPIPLALFYWRYRVPLALAGLVLSIALTCVVAVLLAFERALGIDVANPDYVLLLPLTLLVGALAVFAIAMRYDVSDPQRLTTRSDIAFWLHLAAAPALLYSLMGLVFLVNGGATWWDGQASFNQATSAIVIVAVFMLVGLVIDRRAFVTSGLLSLGGAIWTVLSKTNASLDSYVFIALAVVGVTVLFIGIFWQRLRRMVIDLLPETITARLHAAP
ncbi:hypothetical protein ASE71_24910 [Ensifer sp. Root954]|nr:hypothetical protein ASD49_26545 [Ensifer sp. Root1298]KQX90266.1 hypothetical protein ASD41_25230 [Ensifer sp. Root1312]KRC25471.1 hypothetical protein ASE29_23685 [Ensifer sp. Root74]KRD67328.1 hypothetical protein ASE71_24910 [Ensifer sp. Root954]